MTEQELLDQPKEQVIERQFKNNCDYGFKQRNVNYFIRLAFESGFENGMNYQKYSNSTAATKSDLVSKEMVIEILQGIQETQRYASHIGVIQECITKIKEI